MEKASLNIAIVDDHDLLREQARFFVSLMGHIVVLEARNGKELLDLMETVASPPDLCIVDVDMPVMNGFETTQHLHERYPSVKILAYSLFADKRTIEKILSCGANEFLPKESTPDTWRRKINAYK